MSRVAFLAVSFLVLPVFTAAQPAPAESAGSQSPSESTPPERVIDVEAARRAKAREHSLKASEIPMLPFKAVGRGIKKGLVAVDRHRLREKAQYYMTERESGFLPLFGGLGVGAGFTLGGKYYTNNFLCRGCELDLPVRVSSALYQEYGVEMRFPVDTHPRLSFDAVTHYRVRTQDDFFGPGNDSSVENRTSYMLQTREVLFGPRFELARRANLVMRFGYVGSNVFNGEDPRFPVISERFSSAHLPGLANGAREWVALSELAHDSRRGAGPKRGGFHRLAAGWHQSADENRFSYWRYEVEAERYLPLGSRNRTLALRFLGITNQPRRGNSIPFFQQAFLGGSTTMRGFREFRFYDQSAVLATAEYRYNLNPFTDVVMFVDQGQVARQPGDFSWRGLRTSYGAGLRFLTERSVPFKILFGRSNEGTRIYFSLGGSF